MRRIFAGILCMGVLFTGAVPCSASAPLGYDEYGDPIVTATPVPDSQAGQSTQAAVTHSAYYAQAADTDSIDGWPQHRSPGCRSYGCKHGSRSLFQEWGYAALPGQYHKDHDLSSGL